MKRLRRRILSICTAIAAAVCAVPANSAVSELFTAPVTAQAATSSGSWGSCSWTLDSTGKLTISGSGTVSPKWYDSGVSSAADYPVKTDVKSVVINSGITGIYTDYATSGFYSTVYWYGFSGCTNLKTVTLPSTLKTLCESCFSGCTALTSVNLPAALSAIPKDCFYQCVQLTGVTLPTNLESIGEAAFQGSGLTSLTTNKYLSGIGSSAFASCASLSTVTLTEGLYEISASAFYNCDSLKTVTVPASVTKVANRAFGDCLTLESVKFLSRDTVFNASTGLEKQLIYNRSLNSNYYYEGKIVGYKDSTADTYAAACGYTFEAISEAPTSGTCGANAKWSYDAETRELTITGSGAMTNYTSVLSCPWSEYTGKISHVNVGKGITGIGDYAFAMVVIKSITLPYGLQRIGKYAFAITGLKSVYIPDTVTEIGEYAFAGLLGAGVTGIHLPNSLPKLSKSVLAGTSLYTVTVPASVTEIAEGALTNITTLTDVYILNPDCVFYADASPITNVGTTADDPNEFNGTIHGYYGSTAQAFAKKYGYKFEAIDKDRCGEFLKWKYNTSNKTLTITGYGEMFDFGSAENVPWYQYANSIESVSLPDTLTHITGYAFYNLNKLKFVSIPASVEQVDAYAFGRCSQLQTVAFHGKDTQIFNSTETIYSSESFQIGVGYSYNFYGTIYGYYGSTAQQYAENCSYGFRPIDRTVCGSNLKCSYDGASKTLTITGTGEMYDFKHYNETPWYDVYGDIEHIVLPEGLTSIGNYAFGGTSHLLEITVPSTVTRIGHSAFVGTSARTVALPEGLKTIGDYAFEYASSLQSLTIPGSVTQIGQYALSAAFAGEPEAAGILTFAEGVTVIPAQVANSARVKKVYLPESLSKIESGAFANCYVLTDIYIPNASCSIYDVEETLSCCEGMTVHGHVNSTAQAYAETYGINFEPLVAPKPVITKQPADVTASAGATAKFTVTASGSDLKYQWQFNNGAGWKNSTASGAKTAALSIEATAARDGQKYRCVIRDGSSEPANSTAAVLKVKPTITAQPKSVTAVIGTTAKFTVATDAKSPSYQWQYDNGSGWKNSTATGAKTAELSIEATAARNGQKYRCIVKAGSGASANSAAAVLTTAAAQAVITAQPTDCTAAVGETAKFTVTATGTGLTYQWQYDNGSGWKNSSAAGAKTAALSIEATAARDGQKYRCLVTAGSGTPVPSNAAVLKIKAKVTVQPKNVTASAGGSAVFTVKATGTGLTYQWQYNTGSGWKNSTQSDAKTATLNVEALSYRSGYQYRCIVKSANGTSDTSAAATLTVS